MITPVLIFSGCSGGAGMQATPPLPIAQTSGPAEGTPSQTTADETAAHEPGDAAAAAAPISKSVPEETIPTGAGGRFLRA